LSLLFINNFNF